MSANYVARETGFAMHGWGHGDRMTNDAFSAGFETKFDELLRDVRMLGFDTIDVWGAHLNVDWATDEHVATARRLLDDHGMTIGSYQVWVGPRNLERACDIAAVLGSRSLSGNVPVEDPRLESLLAERGLQFAFENHPEKTPAEVLAKLPAFAGVCVDTGWLGTQGYPAPQALEELGDRVFHVHLKDVLAVGEPHETCRWGEGVVDIEGCVDALQRIGYDGTVVVEHEPETFDPSDDVRAMREQLEEWLG
ncbi:MAG: sugar phosphate isomerase/epimerase family protein [Gaiellaceae bacterium]